MESSFFENQQPEKPCGFKSRNDLSRITLVEEFEKDLYGVVTSIKYHSVATTSKEN